jgi:hypothetical protein
MNRARVRLVDKEIGETMDLLTDVLRVDQTSKGLVVTDQEGTVTVLDAEIHSVDFAKLTVEVEKADHAASSR